MKLLHVSIVLIESVGEFAFFVCLSAPFPLSNGCCANEGSRLYGAEVILKTKVGSSTVSEDDRVQE